MAVRLLSYQIADLCLGKPPLRSLPSSATVAAALAALKSSEDTYISVWSCDHSKPAASAAAEDDHCRCIGKICMVDIICFLSRESNLSSPSAALKSPISSLLPSLPHLVRHVHPSSNLLEAIDLILEGAQNLVVPIQSKITSNSRRKLLQKASTIHNGFEYCWLTQEDVIRFVLSSIGLFSPIPALSIDKLNLIRTQYSAIGYYSPASSAIGAILSSLAEHTSVAVVDDDGILIGEISPFTLNCCDETVAAAIATLSAGDLMAYIDCGGPPEDMVAVVKARLKERNLEGMLEEFAISEASDGGSSSNSSSDEESVTSPTAALRRSWSSGYSARMVRRAEAIVCHPWSSLVAVMIQAIAHRVNYVWVIEDDNSLTGIVTFTDMLEVFREHLQAMA